jgi:acetyl esterase/lipase
VQFLERLDPELAPHLEGLPPLDFSGDLPALRDAARRAEQPLLDAMPDVPGVASVDHLVPGRDGDPDVRVRVYQRVDRAPGAAAMLWIHGGGMVFGSVEGDDFMCRTWASKLGCVIASVDYRLAPEHQYPAHVDDCYAALLWLARSARSLDIDPARVAIGGASAGGGLAAGTALLARDRGEVALCFQLLVFPMLDDRGLTSSSQGPGCDKVWNGAANRDAWAAYLGERAGGDDVPVYAAPARASVEQLRDLPPAYIDVGELDPFRDEDIAYAARLLEAGVPCELHVTPGVYHASESRILGAASSRRIRGYRSDALRRVLGDA